MLLRGQPWEWIRVYCRYIDIHLLFKWVTFISNPCICYVVQPGFKTLQDYIRIARVKRSLEMIAGSIRRRPRPFQNSSFQPNCSKRLAHIESRRDFETSSPLLQKPRSSA